MDKVALTCLKVLIDEKCDEIDDEFKVQAAKFIKSVIMTTCLQLLQQSEAQMSQDEKESLAKYLAKA